MYNGVSVFFSYLLTNLLDLWDRFDYRKVDGDEKPGEVCQLTMGC
jgi:hypothetical protein